MIFTQTLTRFGKKMLHYVILYHVDAKITSTLLANAIFKIIPPPMCTEYQYITAM